MHKLFVDLDGVLADFDEGVLRLTGKRPEELEPRAMWPRLARADGFYEFLAWMPDGRDLWNALSSLNPTILTGLPRGAWAEPQKRAWCARELGEQVPVITCMSRNKHRHAKEVTPDAVTPVLVDDRERLRDAWEKMGGRFVHHTSTSTSLAALSELLPELQNT